MLARGIIDGGNSTVYFPCRPGNPVVSPTKGAADPRSHAAVLSVNYGTSGAQVDALRALLTRHRELGAAIISVQEFKAIYAGDPGPEFLIFLGAFRGYGAGAVSNMIALRKAVFEWDEGRMAHRGAPSEAARP